MFLTNCQINTYDMLTFGKYFISHFFQKLKYTAQF